ncbi:Gfo/Idh/MocA family protein [Streptomyces melanosporofaciens]|uniref:Gfo/Idh/MocA family protein n=1 Tax=Streptomyces melanosporofaciens TaxID=67327 RepID=UPI000A7F1D12|nr:Gfo/Idh/MocA family oxidoreductase [Streptomyces melanosporofaciens]
MEVIVNLTTPAAHVEIATAALRAGKHVWSEKPFSLDRESGLRLLKEADEASLRLGCAPDTFLGAGLQTARRVIERGDIGVPLTAHTIFQTPGPESWHPNPSFLFQRGAGPLFDMGPYYLTALVQTFGSVRRVSAVGSTAKATRTVGSGSRMGEEFAVEVPTHVSALIEFASGGSANSIFSFDTPHIRAGLVEITGTEATLSLPDPNFFDGELKMWPAGGSEWTTVETTGPADGRGLGVLDMARSIRSGDPHRATGQLAHHVLDAMVSVTESIDTGSFVDVASSASTSSALPEDWSPGEATL